MTRLRIATSRTFRSMHTRNFRLYFFGQVVSGTGSWMQTVAQAWLVLRLTDSGVALGITLALQFTPILLVGAWGGVLADRFDKRRMLVATATAAGLLAVVLGALVALGVVQVWMVYVLALLLGCVTAVDNPARRAFVAELVPPEHVANAVSLNSAVFTAARVIGPAAAGFLIAGVGVAWCFFANALSFGAVIIAFFMMEPDHLWSSAPVTRAKGQLRAGFHYSWNNPALRLPLIMTAVIGTFSFNFQVVLPLMAERVFHAGAAEYGTLFAVTGFGSLIGALTAAHRARGSRTVMIGSAFALGVSMLAAALAPTLALELVVLVPMGASSMVFMSMATAVLHEHTDPAMRGRVMALFAVAFLGSTPIGGPIVGWVSQAYGARAGIGIGALTALVTATFALRWRRAGHSAVAETPAMPVAAA